MKIVTSVLLAAAGCCAVLAPSPGAHAMCPPFTRPEQRVDVDGDQRVFIYHRNGMEDLVLQTAVKGTGEDFGMLLPLPSIPDIRKVEFGFFDELHQLTRTRDVAWREAAEGMGAKGMMANDQALERVEVVKNQLVGPFETVVLKARKMDALCDWLKENSYQVTDADREVMSLYLKQEWYFVAVKMSPEAKGKDWDGRAQPVGFRFATKDIVLPTRMASRVPNGMAFTIYVLTNSRVSLPGFTNQTVSLARPVSGDELKSFQNIAAVMEGDVLLSPDGAIGRLAEAQKAVDPKQHADFMNNRFRGLFLSKFNGFFPKDKLAEKDVVFQRENVLDAAAVGKLLDTLAAAPAQAAVARQLLEAGGSEQLEAVAAGLKHTDYRIRRATAEILGVISDTRSAPALLDVLRNEPDDFVKSGANRALQAMTGQAFKSHQVDKWEGWIRESR